jgi:hypothetical protein
VIGTGSGLATWPEGYCGLPNDDLKMTLENATREGWLAAALALLLVIDLSSLAWFSYVATLRVGGASVSFGGSLTATDAPDGWLGILALFASALVIGDILVHRFSPSTPLPAIESRELTRVVLASAAAVFMALKFLLHLGSVGNLGMGFWLGAVLVTGLVVVTHHARQLASTPAADRR